MLTAQELLHAFIALGTLAQPIIIYMVRENAKRIKDTERRLDDCQKELLKRK